MHHGGDAYVRMSRDFDNRLILSWHSASTLRHPRRLPSTSPGSTEAKNPTLWVRILLGSTSLPFLHPEGIFAGGVLVVSRTVQSRE